MIRIELPESINYFRLRREYLERIAKYVKFDEKDILPDKTSSGEGKTEDTAKDLRENFRGLYQFLYDEGSGQVKTENLRWLLAGPDIPPESFGGIAGFKTMNEGLREIINQCKLGGIEDEIKVKDLCKKIFDYDKFVKEQDEAYWLLRTLKVRVCPYCNRVYTLTLPTREELEKLERGEEFKTTRATYDHFYSQSQYPYLSLSLFNLVPSCNVCNSNKNNKSEEIVYPYDEEFGKNAVFRLIPDLKEVHEGDNAFGFLTGESDKFHVRLMGKDTVSLLEKSSLESRLADIKEAGYRERIIDSIQMFHLEQLYNELKPEIRDILRNRYYFNDEYIESVICPLLEKQLSEDGKNVSREQIWYMAMDMLFCTRLRQEEWKERPLSKLTADILEYIDIEK